MCKTGLICCSLCIVHTLYHTQGRCQRLLHPTSWRLRLSWENIGMLSSTTDYLYACFLSFTELPPLSTQQVHIRSTHLIIIEICAFNSWVIWRISASSNMEVNIVVVIVKVIHLLQQSSSTASWMNKNPPLSCSKQYSVKMIEWYPSSTGNLCFWSIWMGKWFAMNSTWWLCHVEAWLQHHWMAVISPLGYNSYIFCKMKYQLSVKYPLPKHCNFGKLCSYWNATSS